LDQNIVIYFHSEFGVGPNHALYTRDIKELNVLKVGVTVQRVGPSGLRQQYEIQPVSAASEGVSRTIPASALHLLLQS
jgi:hypothetical protein